MPSFCAGHGAAGVGGSVGGSALLPALQGDTAAVGLR